jgi:hypothetical protein
MPFAFWLPRLKKIIEMGGSFRKRASGTTIKDPGRALLPRDRALQ